MVAPRRGRQPVVVVVVVEEVVVGAVAVVVVPAATVVLVASGSGEAVRVRLYASGGKPELLAERRLAAAPEPVRLTLLRGFFHKHAY